MVIGMNAFRPAIAYFLFECSAREFQPTFVDICTKQIYVRDPDKNWCMVSHSAKTLFTLLQRYFTTNQLSAGVSIFQFPGQLVEIAWTLYQITGGAPVEALSSYILIALIANQDHGRI